jgi:hypothetical protein
MADRPANAGSGSGLAPMGNTAPPLDTIAPPPFDTAPPPPPVHHDVPPATRPYPGDLPHPAARPRPDARRPDARRPDARRPDAPRLNGPQADAPRPNAPRAEAPRTAAGHRAARSREARDGNDPVAGGLAWLPYLIVLAGAAAGMFVAWQGSRHVARGTELVGCSLLAAALARLILPPHYAGLLSTRRKASDVLAFAVFGAAVLAVALILP